MYEEGNKLSVYTVDWVLAGVEHGLVEPLHE